MWLWIQCRLKDRRSCSSRYRVDVLTAVWPIKENPTGRKCCPAFHQRIFNSSKMSNSVKMVTMALSSFVRAINKQPLYWKSLRLKAPQNGQPGFFVGFFTSMWAAQVNLFILWNPAGLYPWCFFGSNLQIFQHLKIKINISFYVHVAPVSLHCIASAH